MQPFREIGKRGPIPLGQAVLTSAGKLPFRGIIHVAGINGFWRASGFSIRHSVRSAIALAEQHNYHSLALPIIGSGAGNFSQEQAVQIIVDELAQIDSPLRVVVVEFVR